MKYLILILFPFLLNAQSHTFLTLMQEDIIIPDAPEFFDETVIVRQATTSMVVAMPDTVNANDILIIPFICFQGATTEVKTITTPVGWAIGDTVSRQLSTNSFLFGWMWKRAAGDEDGSNVSITTNGTDNRLASLSYSGCVETGTPFEANTFAFNSTTAVSTQEITTLGNGRLVVGFLLGTDDTTLGEMTGWSKDYEDVETLGSPDVQFTALSKTKDTAGVVPAGTATNGAATSHYTFTFALIPQ